MRRYKPLAKGIPLTRPPPRAASLLGCLVLTVPMTAALPALADTTEVNANDPVLQAWRLQNFGGPSPELVRQEDGSTRIVWNGNVTLDTYTNQIESASGSMNSAMLGGSFRKLVVQSDLRGIGADGRTTHFQLGWTASDDLAVLASNTRQINNLQVGFSGQDYLLALGDVMPNYSNLGSALGLRGMVSQIKSGDVTVYAYAGLVAQSWEALGGQVPRQQYLRDVLGGKVEYQLLPALRIYATMQSGEDRAGSLPAGVSFLPPLSIHSLSAGFQYQENSLQISGEYARGSSQAEGQARTDGNALLLDATWQLSKVVLRGGYHDLGPGFATLSGMAQAGVWETYLNADWTVAGWLTLGSDLRNSKNRTLASVFFPASTTRNDANTWRANMNFGPNLPGWGVSLKKTDGKQRDMLDQLTRNFQSNASLNYNSPSHSASVSYGSGESLNQAIPDYSSENTAWQFSLARNYSDATFTAAPEWNLSLSLSGGIQKQVMALGAATSNVNYSIGLNGQRQGWGNLQLGYSEGYATQPYGGPDMRQRGLQLEASRPLLTSATLKLYLRDNQRNIGDAVLAARESVSGVQLLTPF